MAFELPPLPYAYDALQPYMSAETLEFHHGKHHKAYVDKTNALVEEKGLGGASLSDVIRRAKAQGDSGLFNNAAQVWNHTFYWNCMKPGGGGEPGGTLADAIKKTFGSFAQFKDKFSTAAAGQFGSGWAWLVKDKAGNLAVEATPNAVNPMTDGKTPIFTCDVWEHAYYIDYRNARPKYIENFWNVVNWDFVESNYKK